MKNKILLLSIMALIMLTANIGINVTATQVIPQGTPEVKVINPQTGDGNFIFSSNTTSVGARFNATMWLYDAPELYSFQVKLYVNDTLLSITRGWIPLTDANHIFYGLMALPLGPTFYDLDNDNATESVLLGATIMGAGSASGSGLLAIVEFEIIYTPPSGTVSCDLNIDNPDTKLLNPVLAEVLCTKTGGYYEYSVAVVPEPPHAEFTYSPDFPIVGETVLFDASASTPDGGTIVSYIWNFGDGTPEVTETDPTTTHTYSSVGSFNATLIVTDTEGLSDIAWRVINVLPSEYPLLAVEPSFSVVTQGDMFYVNVTIKNLDENLKLTGLQFKLQYNDTFIEALEVTEGPFLKDPAWAPYGTHFIGIIEDDPLYGPVVTVGMLIFPNDTGHWTPPFPSGGGTLATIKFNVTATVEGATALILNNTKLVDCYVNEIVHDTAHGSVEVSLIVHDIAVESVTPWFSEVYEGWKVNITVTVKNEGEVPETFTVTCLWSLCCNETSIIGIANVTDLPPNATETVVFTWHTTDLGVYLIKAEASVVPGEKDTADNILTSPTAVWVKLLGDINGDNKVDIEDIAEASIAFGTYPGHPRWNEMADMNQDGEVNMIDLILIAMNFGRVYP